MSSNPLYDELWRTAWGDLQRIGPVHRHMHGDVARLVSELDVETVIDVGCGSGELLALLAAAGRYELCGADFSHEALMLARKRVPTARFEVLDIEHASLADTFDFVMSIQVVEHLVDDISAFRHMAEMSSRYVYISTMGGRMRRSERATGHVRNYGAVELQTKLELAGLEVLDVHGWGFPFFSPLVRSAAEYLTGGAPDGRLGPGAQLSARLLYQLYRANIPRRGDILSALARKRQAAS